MPRPDGSRLLAETYPVTVDVEPRFQDLDPLGHINNVAMAGIFEAGRIKFNHLNGTADLPRAPGDRLLIASIAINYIAEAHFPAMLRIGNGIKRIGTASWEIAAAAFQNGQCVATCDCTLVYTDKQGARALRPEFAALLEKVMLKG